MTNPFEDPDALYVVLINSEEQYSLWPSFAEIPAGWRAAHGPAPRQECLAHIEENWTDMRPSSLRKAMAQS
ncbi:MbtH family protein [Streptomyces sp. NPDC058964]|uniref:MbtH family protein n=1 Tax=Streptomyces sp. NPDC058964 TaxID=3346681 RepID=UPI0036AA5D0D